LVKYVNEVDKLEKKKRKEKRQKKMVNSLRKYWFEEKSDEICNIISSSRISRRVYERNCPKFQKRTISSRMFEHYPTSRLTI